MERLWVNVLLARSSGHSRCEPLETILDIVYPYMMPKSPLPRAVIFDMDGLIFDTETLYQQALLELAQEQGLGAINTTTVQATIGLSWEETREFLARLLKGVADTDELIRHWKARYERLSEQHVNLKPGVTELLAALDAMAIPRAVATGSYRAVALRHLSAHDLAGYFGAVVTKEDCHKGKPAPDPFIAAASCLGIAPSDCWALEDSLNGVISAHTAGMKTIMIPDLVSPNEDAKERCFLIANSLYDVLDLLVK